MDAGSVAGVIRADFGHRGPAYERVRGWSSLENSVLFPCVIPKPRVFISGARNLARIIGEFSIVHYTIP